MEGAKGCLGLRTGRTKDLRSHATHRTYCLQPLHCTDSKRNKAGEIKSDSGLMSKSLRGHFLPPFPWARRAWPCAEVPAAPGRGRYLEGWRWFRQYHGTAFLSPYPPDCVL